MVLGFTISCKSEKHNENSREGKDDIVISKFDTIFELNAPKRITRNIKLDNEGSLLIAAYDDIIRFNGKSFTLLKKQEGIESWYAFDALEDKKGNIWIASDQSGAFLIDGQTGLVTNFSTEDGLGHKRNMCVYEDKSGNIWIGGQGGLSRFDGVGFNNFTEKDGLPHNDINTILEDSKGNIWIGTRGNAGIYDGNTFTKLKNEEDKSFFNVWSIIEDKSENIWLVDSSGLWKYSNDTFIHELQDVWKIYEDSKGDFWFTGMLKGGASTLKIIKRSSISTNKEFDVKEVFKSDKMFFGIVEDEKGKIWIGGGDGIWMYDGEKVDYYTGIMKKEE